MAAEARLVERIQEICAEFPRYGYRRVSAQLKAEGERVNHKHVARIMREQDLRARPKRRFVVTTDSDHDGPIFPDLAEDLAPTGPDRPRPAPTGGGWPTRPPSASRAGSSTRP